MKLSELQQRYKNILMICEKPSLAKAAAAALPGKMKTAANKLSIECEGGITIAMLAGHVMSLADPEVYNEIWGRPWRAEVLPIVVNNWKNVVTPKKRVMFNSVKDLISKADCIINAGDPDREGQLLVDEVIDHCNFKKPVYRFLGGNNLEITAIQKSFNEIKDNKEFESLKKSALARQRADWNIGMNITRLITLYMQQLGFVGTSPVGRVKTPVMSLVVENINTINNFKSIEHFSLKTSYTKNNIIFFANWQIPKNLQGLDDEGRLTDINIVNSIIDKIKADNEGMVISYKSELKKEKHPLCFNQAKISSAAGKKYNYKPAQVLAICQRLYEIEELTYPRSECEYLPESQFDDAQHILNNICELPQFQHLKNKVDTKIKSRVWSDKETDPQKNPHHAIIPTLKKSNYDSLAEAEKNIYDLIVTMYIAQFLPEHEYRQVTIEICIADQTFKAIGKTTTKIGWRELFGKNDSDDESTEKNETAQILPELEEGEELPLNSVDLQTKKTTPPKPFTQTTLGDAMVNIHNYVIDKKIKDILKETNGIGTSATRSDIIKDLCENSSYKDITGKTITIPSLLEERGKKGELYPSPKALKMYEILPYELKVPDTTAIWEKDFNDIVLTNSSIEPFTTKIDKIVSDIVNKYKGLILPKVIKPKAAIPITAKTCPKCKKGKMIIRGVATKFFGCTNYPTCKHTEKIPVEMSIM